MVIPATPVLHCQGLFCAESKSRKQLNNHKGHTMKQGSFNTSALLENSDSKKYWFINSAVKNMDASYKCDLKKRYS